MTDIVERLRRGSSAIYAAVEEVAARDISHMMKEAADDIEALLAEIERLQALLKGSESLKAGYIGECERLRALLSEVVNPDNEAIVYFVPSDAYAVDIKERIRAALA
jgi:hypothetical protein